MFALSSAWNADRWDDGRNIAEEIYDLGFRYIELNFSLTRAMVDEIIRFSRLKNIAITSLHNYCPIPEGLKRNEALPDCFSLSSIDENERKKAVECTKITISTAKKAGASAVILHCGKVEIEDKTRALIDLYRAGEVKTKAYQDIIQTFIQARKKRQTDYFAQILKSLDELGDYAEKHSIVLGIENRFYYREIPSVEEFDIIFTKFKDKPVAYWHDVGHAFILEKLGFMEEGMLMKRYGPKLFGLHLHNIKDLNDHQAPHDGDFDFNVLKPYVRRQTLKVIEAHGQAAPESIRRSVEYLKGVFGD